MIPPQLATELVLDAAAATLYALVSVLSFAAAARLRTGRRATLLLGWAMAQHTIDQVLGGGLMPVALDVPQPASAWVATVVGYFVAVPWAMLVEELIGPGWKSSVRRTWQGYLLFGVVAVMTDVVTGRLGTAAATSRIVNAAGALVGFLNVLHTGRGVEMRALRAGILIFMALVVNDAAADAGWLPWTARTGPVGVLICVGAIAFTVVTRTFRARNNLLALEHELATARRIQGLLVPGKAPVLDGASIGFRYVPAAAVAGDLFEFLAPGRRGTGVLVADVSGHGVSAALIASMVKVAASAQKAHADDPAKVLAGIHLALAGELPPGHFVTAVYAHVDLDRGALRYASAGHPPPLIWHTTSRTVLPDMANGPMIISFAPAEYPVHEVPLAAGDRVLLFTDGVIEAMRPDDAMFGVERLREVVGAATDGPVRLATAVIDAAAGFSGRTETGFDDDCTVVAIEIGTAGDLEAREA
ncbi:MAG: PP2C family protein-serine/threonine phosphatase [Acidobacteriota bacterium]